MMMESPALDSERLRFSYAGGSQVLDIPRLVVGQGERVFLRGPSGSGKSTLLGVASGVLPAGDGKVESLGRDLGALSSAARDALVLVHWRHEKAGDSAALIAISS
jgi:putative ABC transport system ATP-binding protein